jgi:rhodanese-related sulfurtransferase
MNRLRPLLLTMMALLLIAGTLATPAQEPQVQVLAPDVFDAVTPDRLEASPEISTRELQLILSQGEAIVFDARPTEEYALGHIPGALNLAAKPGVPLSVYVSDVAELDRLLEGNRATSIVLYCNGLFCGRGKRLAEDLLAAGYRNVRRYQLGIPAWRALGGVTVIEPAGLHHVMAKDGTAVLVDAREPDLFAEGSLKGAINLPLSVLAAELQRAQDEGRLPAKDHNARIVVFGRDGKDAREVAAAIAGKAYHNVSYFDQSYERLTSRAVIARRL